MTARALPILPVLRFSGLFRELTNPDEYWGCGMFSCQFSNPFPSYLYCSFFGLVLGEGEWGWELAKKSGANPHGHWVSGAPEPAGKMGNSENKLSWPCVSRPTEACKRGKAQRDQGSARGHKHKGLPLGGSHLKAHTESLVRQAHAINALGMSTRAFAQQLGNGIHTLTVLRWLSGVHQTPAAKVVARRVKSIPECLKKAEVTPVFPSKKAFKKDLDSNRDSKPPKNQQ